MNDSPFVSIIVLNFNAGELLLDCVKSVFNRNYNNFEVIVVDNVSNDNSHKKCKERFEKIQLKIKRSISTAFGSPTCSPYHQ